MTTRTRSKIVTFRYPFRLSAVDDLQPAGPYLVETDEEAVDGLSVSAYRRLSTLIRLVGRPGSSELSRTVNIDPAELAAILADDAQNV